MRIALRIIAVFLVVAILSAGGFVAYKCSQGISYDISSVEKVGTDVEIISESVDNITIRKNSDGEFRVLMFTDTHFNGKKEKDNLTASYIVRNITEVKPDLVIFGGDNVTSGFNEKRNRELAQLLDALGVYWAAVLGNHEGKGLLAVSREKNVEIFSSYEYCLMLEGKDSVDGHGNYSVTVLNADDSVKEVFFFMDSGSYMTDEAKAEYGVTDEGDVYDGVKNSQVVWYKENHDAIENEYGKFNSVTVLHIPPYQTEAYFDEDRILYGEKREGICESGFDSGLFAAMKEKGSAHAVYFGHDHVNDFAYMCEGILLSYIQPSGYGVYNMESKFDAPENEWIQGCTLLTIYQDGTCTSEGIFNHQK